MKIKNIKKTKIKNVWKIWADTLGVKADINDDKHSDKVAIIRTLILLVYLITNIFIIINIIKHW